MTIVANGKGSQPLESKYKEVVENNLQWVHKQSGDHLLLATEDRVVRVWNIWSGSNVRPTRHGIETAT
jgi:hypothetical protein